ncbi:MAG: hypothetical protein E6Q78_05325 [Rhodoferax sp.]|nr:MAG: hypothetical protein E6Q78_05325 [Rhodoferax sp.]
MNLAYAIYAAIVICIAAAFAPAFGSFIQAEDECHQQVSKMASNPFDHAQEKRAEEACNTYVRSAVQLSKSIPISK